ncbi:uncharacterized protein MYCGRDRAFT_111751 [Zymoseptoria tritici IPO323]|uniref:Uncharacterized protein n=1 Tax=Zymoseptoria tritici (strain CBS 115943 / IPO323) TaxID=336722 RepID=F9XQZ6_ZYMTI|nr:uncharacterized protein MYCGRDRAFT_111751 [Zymoseptoria tritici IPO323]EGP82333.1 hypothetical protein MYCGRDRAFT_111751 [Zymoseptoria tritici IPO323]
MPQSKEQIERQLTKDITTKQALRKENNRQLEEQMNELEVLRLRCESIDRESESIRVEMSKVEKSIAHHTPQRNTSADVEAVHEFSRFDQGPLMDMPSAAALDSDDDDTDDDPIEEHSSSDIASEPSTVIDHNLAQLIENHLVRQNRLQQPLYEAAWNYEWDEVLRLYAEMEDLCKIEDLRWFLQVAADTKRREKENATS